MTYSRYWINSYPPGVPADIDPLQIRSVAHLAEESFMRFADRVAFVQMGRNITYRELDAQTRAFGAWLQQHTGLKRGGRVAIMMPNLLQYPIALFGVLRAGGTVVNTNPLYTARELEHQLKDSGAETVVILENFAHVLQEVIGRTQVKHVVVTSVGELLGFPKGAIVDFVVRTVRKQVPAWSLPGHHRFLDVLAAGARHALQQIDLGHDDLAFLQYTGGTTGVSKGAMLSHGNIVANTLQSTAWTEPAWPRDTHGTAITALPLYHIFALTGNCIVFLRLGWTNVLITNPRDFPAFVKELKKHRFTFISGVNTLFNALLHTPGFETVDFSALRCTLGGGMAVQRAVAERWKQVTGCILTQAWGLTETSPGACINPIT
jgi:long-chain acyl-CoA synthetase